MCGAATSATTSAATSAATSATSAVPPLALQRGNEVHRGTGAANPAVRNFRGQRSTHVESMLLVQEDL